MDTEPASPIGSSDDQLRCLQEEHRRYSQQLEALASKPYLSEDERLEEVRLKKLKLSLKDKIHEFHNRASGVTSVA